MTRVALLRCDPLPEPDPDELPLIAAFGEHDVLAEGVPWRDAGDLSRFDAVVVRATWDYHLDPDAFSALLSRAASQSVLVNPLEVCLGNLHKGYLLELPERGVPIVPTRLFGRRDSCDVASLGWPEVVIKPAISCGSWRTRRLRASDPEAQRFFDALVADRDVLVQPAMAEFADPGERALIWIDGKVTHAVQKQPRFAGEDEQCSLHAPITQAERVFADLVVSTLPEPPSFARVDVIEGADGLMLSELEALEPSLHFRFFEDAAGALARAVLAKIASRAL